MIKPSVRQVLFDRKLWQPTAIPTALWLDAADDSTITLNYVTGSNLFTEPEAFDSSQWTKINCTISPNIAIAPDGTLTADKIVSTSGTLAMRPQQIVTTEASTVYTVSAFFKAAEVSWISFRLAEDTAPSCWFNIAGGVVGTLESAWTSSSITSVGNGWFRCQATFTTIGTSYTVRFILASNNNISSYTGNGTDGVLIWGAMLNQGSSANQYKAPQVSQWLDKSGNLRHVSQGVATNQPTYNDTGLNGKPVLRFNHLNNQFLSNTGTFTLSGGAVLAFVASHSDITMSGNFSVGRASHPVSWTSFTTFANHLPADGNPLLAQWTSSTASSSRPLLQDGVPVAMVPHVWIELQSGSALTGGIDGTMLPPVAATINNPSGVVIGSGSRDTGLNQFFDGDLAEVVAIRSNLSTDDRQRLEGYLAWKWGLETNLPSNHPYKYSPPRG